MKGLKSKENGKCEHDKFEKDTMKSQHFVGTVFRKHIIVGFGLP